MKKIMHMIVCAFILALSQVLGAQAAHAIANDGHRFCDAPITSAADLQERIAQSLADKPNGYGSMKGCRASPVHFFNTWKHDFPEANLATMQDLLRFAGELQPMVLKKDMLYQSGCLLERPDHAYDVKVDCTTRPARKGETVYAWHGKPALMSSCANPGVIEIPPIVVNLECIEVDFPSDKAIPTRFAYIGPRPIPSKCVRLHIASEAQSRLEMPDECPDTYQKTVNGHLVTVVCSWEAVEEAASELLGVPAEVQNVSGSFYGKVRGMNKLYLPKEALEGETAICWELPDGRIVTKGVRRQNFVNGLAVITEQDVLSTR